MHPYPPPMVRIRIELFGGPALLVDGRVVRLSPGQRALLGLVAASGRQGIPRAQVMDLLWPGAGDGVPHRLAQLQYALNRRAGLPVVVGEGDLLRLSQPECRSDLDLVEKALSEGEDLAAALRIVERGFLKGLESAGSDALDDWILGRRLRIRNDLRRCAAAAWSRHEDLGNWGTAAELAEILLELDPLDEVALQRFLRSRAMSGRVHEAEAVYRSFQERSESLRRKWTPSRATQDLLDRIRAMQPLPRMASCEARRRPAEVPLVGRGEELRALLEALRAPLTPEMDVVIVSGEAGMGKSRMLNECLVALPLAGARVLRSTPGELERDIPLNALLEALSEEWVGDRVRDLEEPWRTVLLSVLPRFHPGPGCPPDPPEIRPGALPRRLFEAFRILLEALSHDRPLVLVLDDLQWADDTSVAVLDFMRRRWSEGGLRLVVAFRPEALHGRPFLVRALDGARTGGRAVEVSLGELGREDALSLMDRVARVPLSEEEKAGILAMAGANPFFLIELTLEHAAGRLALEPGRRGALHPVPLSIRQVFEGRIGTLDAAGRRCAGLLAVHEDPVEPWALAQMARLTRRQCLRALEQLQALRLVSWSGYGVALRHALVRQTIYEATSPARRAWFHARVAGHLLARSPQAVDRLALHFDRAGLPVRALPYALEAADRSENAGAVAEALHYLDIAKRHTTEARDVARLLGRTAHLRYLHRDFGEALPLLAEAADQLRDVGLIRQSLQARTERVDAASQREALPPSALLQDIHEIKEEARSHEAWEEFARTLDVEARIADRAGLTSVVLDVLAQADAIPDHAGPAAHALAGGVLALHQNYGDPTRALPAAKRAVRLAALTGSRNLLLSCLNREIGVRIHQASLHSDRGRSILAKARKLSSNTGDLGLRFHVTLNEGVWHLDTGDLDRAAISFSAAARLVSRIPPDSIHVPLYFNLGELAIERQDYASAENYFQALANMRPDLVPWHALAVAHAGLGLVALGRGQLTAARSHEQAIVALVTRRHLGVNDPYLIAALQARLGLIAKKPLKDIHLSLLAFDAPLQVHKVLSWLKIKLLTARLLSRFDRRLARIEAEIGLAKSRQLGLSLRATQFSQLLDREVFP